jgi:tRNA A-37 threonylcarbamoyl transferase component Bud32
MYRITKDGLERYRKFRLPRYEDLNRRFSNWLVTKAPRGSSLASSPLETGEPQIHRWSELIAVLERGTPDNNHLVLQYASSKSLSIPLKRISSSNLNLLLASVFKEANPEVIDSPVKTLALGMQLSFTRLWEEKALALRPTNYVPLLVGQSLCNEQMTVTEVLKTGGMSATYVARRISGETVVLKETFISQLVSEQVQVRAREMFQREAKLLSRVNHPSIVKLLDYFVEGGRHYMVLEHIAGTNIRSLVIDHGALKEQTVREYCQVLAQVLLYLHTLQPPVVHRDITPENIVLTDDGNVLLIDFGAANELAEAVTGTIVGKQAYMPPEQFRGHAECASDLYALAGTAFFMLTGRDPEPLAASNVKEISRRTSDSLAGTIFDATQPDVTLRIRTAREFLDRLSQVSR